ncbi:hypothetical protein FA13DRAFT_1149702 [Coprinellus micaceus]|uniref:Uncharacterized protein n=1 Tax=Coprinellus micaceus TaxID=71717 RepID=A0A4Y7SUZ6_COPMI|nr:hypothetical protein FA13DRAFT_1149702 [Coprinellus micaceus]
MDEKTRLQASAKRQRRRGYFIANPIESLHAHREEHYSQVLQILDEAIDAVEVSSRTPASSPNDVLKPTTDPPSHNAKATPAPPVDGAVAAAAALNTPSVASTFPTGVGAPPIENFAADQQPTASPPPPVMEIPSAPAQLTVANQPRRSAAFESLICQPPALPAKVSRPTKPVASALPHPTTQLRRSDRVQKHRLEEVEDDPEVPVPKLRRVKKGPRAATRSRWA